MSSTFPERHLSLYETYRCPVCRRGKISGMAMMDTFACNFCNHIFTADLERQLLKLADSQLSISWLWNGKGWRGLQRQGFEFAWFYLVMGIFFVLLPTTIVGLGAYLFPPLPGSTLSWLPTFWTGLTFTTHLVCLLWLVAEYYQFPVGLYLQTMTRGLFSRS